MWILAGFQPTFLRGGVPLIGKVSKISWTPLLSMAISEDTLPSISLNTGSRPMSTFLTSRAVVLIFAAFHSQAFEVQYLIVTPTFNPQQVITMCKSV